MYRLWAVGGIKYCFLFLIPRPPVWPRTHTEAHQEIKNKSIQKARQTNETTWTRIKGRKIHSALLNVRNGTCQPQMPAPVLRNVLSMKIQPFFLMWFLHLKTIEAECTSWFPYNNVLKKRPSTRFCHVPL